MIPERDIYVTAKLMIKRYGVAGAVAEARIHVGELLAKGNFGRAATWCEVGNAIAEILSPQRAENAGARDVKLLRTSQDLLR